MGQTRVPNTQIKPPASTPSRLLLTAFAGAVDWEDFSTLDLLTAADADTRYFMLGSAQSITAVHNFSAALPTASTMPTASAQFAIKAYVDTKVAKSGDIMTGQLTIQNSYLDVHGAGYAIRTRTFAHTSGFDDFYISDDGELHWQDGALGAYPAPIISISKSLSQGRSWQGVQISAGASAAYFIQNDSPTAANHLANKSYVDAQLTAAESYADAGDTATLNSAKAYTDSASAATLAIADARYVDVTGDTMTGDLLIASGSFARNQSWPQASAHLTNKGYVDAASSSTLAQASAVAWTAASAASAAAVSVIPTTATYDARYFMLGSAQSITAVHDFSASLPQASTQPTASGQFTNKVYVDAAASAVAWTAASAASAAAVTRSTALGDAAYVNVTGDTMTGVLAMMSNTVWQPYLPAASAFVLTPSAQTVMEVDTTASAYTITLTPTTDGTVLWLNDIGSAGVGNASVKNITLTASANTRIQGVGSGSVVLDKNGMSIMMQYQAAASGWQVISKRYGDGGYSRADADARYVDVAGDTMTGNLTINTSSGDNILTINGAVGGGSSGAKVLFARVGSTKFTAGVDGGSNDFRLINFQNAKDAFVASANGDLNILPQNGGNVWLGSAATVTASATPTASGHLTNKLYVDTASAAAIATASATSWAAASAASAAAVSVIPTTATYDSRYFMLGSAQSITAVHDFSASLPTASTLPTASAQFAIKQYVDNMASAASAAAVTRSTVLGDAAYVLKAGDTMTGDLSVKSATPTIMASATTGGNTAMVKALSSTGPAALTAYSDSLPEFFLSNLQGVKYLAMVMNPATGNTSSAGIQFAPDSLEGVTTHVRFAASATYVGGARAGYHVYPGSAATLWHGYAAPTASAHLTNKTYVDAGDAAASAAAVAAIPTTATYDSRYFMLASAQTVTAVHNFTALPTSSSLPGASAQFAIKQYVDNMASAASAAAISAGDARFVNVTGDQMTGALLTTTASGESRPLQVYAAASAHGASIVFGHIDHQFNAISPAWRLTFNSQVGPLGVPAPGQNDSLVFEDSGGSKWISIGSGGAFIDLAPDLADSRYVRSPKYPTTPYTYGSEVANVAYVNDMASAASGAAVSVIGTSFVAKAGDTMYGKLVVASGTGGVALQSKGAGNIEIYLASDPSNAAMVLSDFGLSFGPAFGSGIDVAIQRVGVGIMSMGAGNFLRCTANPVVANDLSRKAYVDSMASAASGAAIATVGAGTLPVDGGSPTANYLFQYDFDGGAADMTFLTAKKLDGGTP